jgi:hypothetical protein
MTNHAKASNKSDKKKPVVPDPGGWFMLRSNPTMKPSFGNSLKQHHHHHHHHHHLEQCSDFTKPFMKRRQVLIKKFIKSFHERDFT